MTTFMQLIHFILMSFADMTDFSHKLCSEFMYLLCPFPGSLILETAVEMARFDLAMTSKIQLSITMHLF